MTASQIVSNAGKAIVQRSRSSWSTPTSGSKRAPTWTSDIPEWRQAASVTIALTWKNGSGVHIRSSGRNAPAAAYEAACAA